MSQPQLLVCMATEKGPNSVPSTVRTCSSCSREVWVSDQMWPYAVTGFVVCEECAISIADEMGETPNVQMPDEQREELKRELNLDDAGVDQLVTDYNRSLFRKGE